MYRNRRRYIVYVYMIFSTIVIAIVHSVVQSSDTNSSRCSNVVVVRK